MEIDYAQVSPSMSAERLANNHQTAVMRLAKKAVEQSGEMIVELISSVPSVPKDVGAVIDLKI